MVFIHTYKQADKIVRDMEKGTCAGDCRKIWRHHIQYAIDTKTNPLKLTASQKKALTKKLKNIKGKRVGMARKSRKQRGGDGMGQPLKYTVADYHEPSANAGRNVQGIVAPITIRPGLEASPMTGGAEALSPMPFEQAYHSKPLAPTGQELTFKLPATLNQGLNMGQIGGKRRNRRSTRRQRTRGGFYPSIMGGVVQNAPLLIPVAARQSFRLLEEYKLLSRKSRRNRNHNTRRNKRTRRNRKSTRRH